jgi:transposase InsO family protein
VESVARRFNVRFARRPFASRRRIRGGAISASLPGRLEPVRFLIRDRDQKFTDSFDEVFRSAGMETVRTPFRAPQANGVAERFVRTVRSECLDWLLVLNSGHLAHGPSRLR